MKWLARLLPAFALVVATAAFALTPGQRTVILGGCPSALQLNGGTCAPIALNFAQNIGRGANGIVQAATSLVTVTRNSIHTCSDTSGNWYQVAANVLCWTNQGALIEEYQRRGYLPEALYFQSGTSSSGTSILTANQRAYYGF